MNLRVSVSGEAAGLETLRRSESEPEQGASPFFLGGAQSEAADAKPSDLHMSRMKSR